MARAALVQATVLAAAIVVGIADWRFGLLRMAFAALVAWLFHRLLLFKTGLVDWLLSGRVFIWSGLHVDQDLACPVIGMAVHHAFMHGDPG